jgi:hypothetical protein
MLRIGVIAALIALASLGQASAATAVGKIGRVQGEATGLLDASPIAVKVGAPVHLDETVKTGTGARLEIVFVDGTTFTVGEKSSVKIDKFVYDPGSPANAIRLAVVGPFRFVSGKLGTTGGARSVVTPFATMGIRGTNFWGGPIDGQFGVFLAEGEVTVTTSTGTAVLKAPGAGVNIRAIGAAPGRVTIWPKAKVARAVATVTFR